MEPAFVTNGLFAIALAGIFIPAVVGLIVLNLTSRY